jgi:hypothetical protein
MPAGELLQSLMVQACSHLCTIQQIEQRPELCLIMIFVSLQVSITSIVLQCPDSFCLMGAGELLRSLVGGSLQATSHHKSRILN